MAWPVSGTGQLELSAVMQLRSLDVCQPLVSRRDLQPVVEVCSAVSVGKHGGLESHHLVSCGDLAGLVS